MANGKTYPHIWIRDSHEDDTVWELKLRNMSP